MNDKNLFNKTLREVGPEMISEGFDVPDLIRFLDLYAAVDRAYSMASRAIDKSGSDRARSYFEEFENDLSEIAMPLEMIFNDLDDSDSWPNERLRSKWQQVHSARY